ncbi:MAG: efflux RND transporter periplasmic adaptor subunit [Ignavibacteriales bacterium]|nr:MAG: efflux RND transporter periplasmic adaptor subunit [Ignavibacteriales bacterium]
MIKVKKMKNKFLKILLLVFIMVTAPVIIFTGCSNDKENAGIEKQIYYCPMHPEVQSDKPGVCPICHMDLVLKDNDNDDMAEHNDDLIQLNNRKLALANVSVSEVKSEKLSKEITSYSYVDFAEQNRVIIAAKFNGRIEKMYVDRTGDYVKKGDALFEIYSPDIIQAQNDYLIASKGFANINISESGSNNNSIIEAAKQKLLYMGITQGQVEEIEKSGKVNHSITYYSPASGTVIEKKVQEGIYVNEGSIIYDIADLTELWIISEIFADDLGFIKKDSKIKFRMQTYPDKEFFGRVDLIYPVINPETRTIKIRSVLPNRDALLKPNMYGNAVFTADIPEGITIPAEAVILTGERSIVWVEKEKGKFEMREIKTGYKINGKYQVLSGLREGERIVSEGTYLIDSESQLRSGKSSGHEQHEIPSGKEENENEHKDHSE